MTSTEFLLTESLLIKHSGFENKGNNQYMKGSQFQHTKKTKIFFFVYKAKKKKTTTLFLRMLFPLPLRKKSLYSFPRGRSKIYRRVDQQTPKDTAPKETKITKKRGPYKTGFHCFSDMCIDISKVRSAIYIHTQFAHEADCYSVTLLHSHSLYSGLERCVKSPNNGCGEDYDSVGWDRTCESISNRQEWTSCSRLSVLWPILARRSCSCERP